jgi:hypothetical protein
VTLRDVYLINESDERPVGIQEVEVSFPGALDSLNDEPNNYDYFVEEDGNRLFALHRTQPSDAIYWSGSAKEGWVDESELVFSANFGRD